MLAPLHANLRGLLRSTLLNDLARLLHREQEDKTHFLASDDQIAGGA